MSYYSLFINCRDVLKLKSACHVRSVRQTSRYRGERHSKTAMTKRMHINSCFLATNRGTNRGQQQTYLTKSAGVFLVQMKPPTGCRFHVQNSPLFSSYVIGRHPLMRNSRIRSSAYEIYVASPVNTSKDAVTIYVSNLWLFSGHFTDWIVMTHLHTTLTHYANVHRAEDTFKVDVKNFFIFFLSRKNVKFLSSFFFSPLFMSQDLKV